MDISFGLSRKDCQVLNLREHAGGNLPWLGIWPPASVQSPDVRIVSLLHYSWERWENRIWASNLHRDTDPAQAQLHGEKLARGALQSLCSLQLSCCPSQEGFALPVLNSQKIKIARSLHGKYFWFNCSLFLLPHRHTPCACLDPARSRHTPPLCPPHHTDTQHALPLCVLSRLRMFVGRALC